MTPSLPWARRVLLMPLLLGAALLVVFGAALWRGTPPPPTSHLIGQPAPADSFPLLADASQSFRPTDWRGRAYLVNFFASWCLPCRAEHPVLQEAAALTGLPLLGVAYRDKPEAARGFLTKHGDPYSLTVSEMKGRGGIAWGLTGVPETFLVDAAGIVRWHQRGPLTEAILRDALLPVVQELR